MRRFDPWSEEPERDKPPTNWGCAVAAIIGSAAAVIALILVCSVAGTAIDAMVHSP